MFFGFKQKIIKNSDFIIHSPFLPNLILSSPCPCVWYRKCIPSNGGLTHFLQKPLAFSKFRIHSTQYEKNQQRLVKEKRKTGNKFLVFSLCIKMASICASLAICIHNVHGQALQELATNRKAFWIILHSYCIVNYIALVKFRHLIRSNPILLPFSLPDWTQNVHFNTMKSN